jgi:hypothetical protein
MYRATRQLLLRSFLHDGEHVSCFILSLRRWQDVSKRGNEAFAFVAKFSVAA